MTNGSASWVMTRVAADVGVAADAAELVHRGEGADRGVVADLDVAGERGVVGEDRAVADLAVVRDVGVDHEQAVAADAGQRRRPWRCRGGRCRTRGTGCGRRSRAGPPRRRTSGPAGRQPMRRGDRSGSRGRCVVGPWIWAPAPISVPSPISTPRADDRERADRDAVGELGAGIDHGGADGCFGMPGLSYASTMADESIGLGARACRRPAPCPRACRRLDAGAAPRPRSAPGRRAPRAGGTGRARCR